MASSTTRPYGSRCRSVAREQNAFSVPVALKICARIRSGLRVRRAMVRKNLVQGSIGDSARLVGMQRVKTAADHFPVARILRVARAEFDPLRTRIAPARVMNGHHQLQPFVMVAEFGHVQAIERAGDFFRRVLSALGGLARPFGTADRLD